MSLYEILLVALFGAAGAVCRYAASTVAPSIFGDRFPYGTLIVNVVGCLLIGFVMELSLSTDTLSRGMRTAITVGLLGALTTFSTFGYETLQLARQGSWLSALSNVTANLAVGILAVGMGIVTCKAIIASGNMDTVNSDSASVEVPAKVSAKKTPEPK